MPLFCQVLRMRQMSWIIANRQLRDCCNAKYEDNEKNKPKIKKRFTPYN